MIIEFNVGNFLSFKEIQTLNLQGAKIKSKYPEVDKNNLFKFNNRLTLLKSKSIFGANESGKSNLIKALLTFLKIIKSSNRDYKILETVEPFRLDNVSNNKPTFFQLSFILGKVPYRYGFEVLKGQIKNEWLFGTPKKIESYFFIREGQNLKVNPNQFKEGYKIAKMASDETSMLRGNSLFLSLLTALNGKLANEIYKYFSNYGIIVGINDLALQNIATYNLSKKKYFAKTLKFLRDSDTGITNIEYQEPTLENHPKGINKNYIQENAPHKVLGEVIFKKNKYSKGKNIGTTSFNLYRDGAEGTKKIFGLSPFIFLALEKGTPFIVDEFDARLHPNLCERIIRLFNSKKTNPKNAQLIFATHNTNLLDARLFRRDQICFVEKNKFGASQLFSLVEFKGIRNDASFEKDYLKGKYGAVPILNNFEKVFQQK